MAHDTYDKLGDGGSVIALSDVCDLGYEVMQL